MCKSHNLPSSKIDGTQDLILEKYRYNLVKFSFWHHCW